MFENLELLNMLDIDYVFLLSEGLKFGFIITFSTGLISVGINYCLKLFIKL